MTKLLKASKAVCVNGTEFRTAAFECNIIGLIILVHKLQVRHWGQEKWQNVQEMNADAWTAIKMLPAFLPA